MFTCKERIVRDGRLVCFKGQVMSDDEAAALGISDPADDAAEQPEGPTVAQLKGRLDELGVPYDKKAKKTVLEELLAQAEARNAAALVDGAGDDDAVDPAEPGDPTDDGDGEGGDR